MLLRCKNIYQYSKCYKLFCNSKAEQFLSKVTKIWLTVEKEYNDLSTQKSDGFTVYMN